MILSVFLSGAMAMACLITAAFFLRFWQKTRESLFLFFSAAFLTLMTERILRTFLHLDDELAPFIYCLRLAAFVMLIVGILYKNRRT